MKKIAIIPARGGSKRIPHKNTKLFLGKPIIKYAIDVAVSSGLFNEVMVSTDDEKTAELSVKLGATVPFLRSTVNSSDFATTAEVISEVLEQYKTHNKYFDYSCCIYPCAVFTTTQTLIDSFELLIKQDFVTVFPVVKYGFPIQRSLKLDPDTNQVQIVMPEHVTTRSQDLPPRFHDSGLFYWVKTDRFLEKKALYTNNSGSIILSEKEVQDIDTTEDWQIAEMKYQLIHKPVA